MAQGGRYVVGTLVGGRNLAAKDEEVYGASSDPYALIWVGAEGDMEVDAKAAVQSQTVFDSLNPVWNMQFQFEGGEEGFGEGRFLHVRLFDFDANSAHDYMGDAVVPLSSPLSNEWVSLRPLWSKFPDEEVKGDIQLSFSFSDAPIEIQAAAAAVDKNLWQVSQRTTFVRWVNFILQKGNCKSGPIDDLATGLKNGVVLADLISVLSPTLLKFKINRNPKMDIHMSENLNNSLKFLKDDGVKIVNISGNDILKENMKLVMGLIWTLIQHYQFSGGVDKEELLRWVNGHVNPLNVQVSDFSKSWTDGNAFAALMCALDSQFAFPIPDSSAVEKMDRAFDFALDRFGVPKLLTSVDVVKFADDKSIMTYLTVIHGLFKDKMGIQEANESDELKMKEEEERIKREEETRLQEESRKLEEEERRREAEELKRKEEEERRRKEEEEERNRREEEERRRKEEEEERKRLEEEERKRLEEEERKRREEEEERKRREEEEERKRGEEEEERKRKEEEEERKRKEEEERKRREEEEERKRIAEEERWKLEEETRKEEARIQKEVEERRASEEKAKREREAREKWVRDDLKHKQNDEKISFGVTHEAQTVVFTFGGPLEDPSLLTVRIRDEKGKEETHAHRLDQQSHTASVEFQLELPGSYSIIANINGNEVRNKTFVVSDPNVHENLSSQLAVVGSPLIGILTFHHRKEAEMRLHPHHQIAAHFADTQKETIPSELQIKERSAEATFIPPSTGPFAVTILWFGRPVKTLKLQAYTLAITNVKGQTAGSPCEFNVVFYGDKNIPISLPPNLAQEISVRVLDPLGASQSANTTVLRSGELRVTFAPKSAGVYAIAVANHKVTILESSVNVNQAKPVTPMKKPATPAAVRTPTSRVPKPSPKPSPNAARRLEIDSMTSTSREVITLHIGQAGVQLGQSCLELFALEHGIGKDGVPLQGRTAQMSNGFFSFFEEGAKGKYVPRSIFVDLDPTVIDDLKAGEFGKMVSPHSLVKGKEDAANNFARGRYTVGKDILDTTMDVFRRLVEKCGSLQGFVLEHSIGGGCGSGFTTLLLEHILSDFGLKKNILDFCIFPSDASLCVVEPYNAVLSASSLIEYTNVTFPFDNQTVGAICKDALAVERPTFENINRLIAQVLSSSTASIRFGGALNVDLNEFQVNLVPFPRLHFLLSSLAPLYHAESAYHEMNTVNDMTRALFNRNSALFGCGDEGTFMSACLLYRGEVFPNEISQSIQAVKSKVRFVDWCPTGFKVGINSTTSPAVPNGDLPYFPRSACLLSNTTSIAKMFQSVTSKFDKMYTKRAFVHWFVGEGMEEGEFAEAREELLALENDYRMCTADVDDL